MRLENMKGIVIDASVVAKWFIDELHSDQARFIRDKFIAGEVDLYVPFLMYFEVLNALKYSNLFEQTELNQAGESLENYGFKEILIKNEVRYRMIYVAVNHQLSIYDAAYVGLSIGLEMLLCTADGRIIKKLPTKLKKNVVHVKNIEEILA